MDLNILECRTCGASFWLDMPKAGGIDGGPCCFGHPMLDIERFPTERTARKAWPAWDAKRLANMRRIWRENHPAEPAQKEAHHG